MSYLKPYIIDPQPGHPHSHTVVLLHGRSSTAEEFASDIFAIKTSDPPQNLVSWFPGLRWVFPNSGLRWCTPFRERRSAWFDTFSLDDLSKRQDLQVIGLREGIQHVRDVLEEELELLGGNTSKLLLGGFSQGSAVALWSLFTGAAMTKGPLGAFIGISAWMPFIKEAQEAVDEAASDQTSALRTTRLSSTLCDIIGLEPFITAERIQESLHNMPVHLGHGIDDKLISIKNCYDIRAILKDLEANTTTQEYSGADRDGHWIKEPEQLDDIAKFILAKVEAATLG